MNWLSKILDFGVGDVVNSVFDIVDNFVTTDKEKSEIKIKLQEILQKRNSELEATLRQELETKERIIVAELQQSDNFTKRARPSVIYFGLFAIAFNYCLIPLATLFLNDVPQAFNLPSEFWLAWGGIVSTYTVSRTFDKRAINPVQKLKSKILGE